MNDYVNNLAIKNDPRSRRKPAAEANFPGSSYTFNFMFTFLSDVVFEYPESNIRNFRSKKGQMFVYTKYFPVSITLFTFLFVWNFYYWQL